MRNLKKKLIQTNLEEYEVCVMCGAVTDIPTSMPLKMRTGYLSGAGQLCQKCAETNITEEREAMRNCFSFAKVQELVPDFEAADIMDVLNYVVRINPPIAYYMAQLSLCDEKV